MIKFEYNYPKEIVSFFLSKKKLSPLYIQEMKIFRSSRLYKFPRCFHSITNINVRTVKIHILFTYC